jgi:hypothetical protein
VSEWESKKQRKERKRERKTETEAEGERERMGGEGREVGKSLQRRVCEGQTRPGGTRPGIWDALARIHGAHASSAYWSRSESLRTLTHEHTGTYMRALTQGADPSHGTSGSESRRAGDDPSHGAQETIRVTARRRRSESRRAGDDPSRGAHGAQGADPSHRRARAGPRPCPPAAGPSTRGTS